LAHAGPLVIVVASYTRGGGWLATIGVIALTGWAASARVLRAQTLSLRSRDYAPRALPAPRHGEPPGPDAAPPVA
jgi:ABC-type dipeptide/oligopeptide/nickel transport system permease subunit